MELDLGIRISRAIENLTFSSTETETVFVLFAHLPGFKKDEIEISIEEEGTKISISGGGERSSIETTISRRLMLATEVIERFQKVFRIPDGVDLDRIDAGFDEENAILIVLIPKLIKGDVSGVKMEEIKQGEDEGGGEEGKEPSLEQDKQGGEATSKEEEQEEKGKGKEPSITEDEQGEKDRDVEVLMKEKEQEAKPEGEEASFKDQQVKESQNGEPEQEKERMGMEQMIPEEETEENSVSRVVPDQPPTPPVPVETHDLGEVPPSLEASVPKEEERQKEMQIPMAPPTPPVPVETHDLGEVPPSSKASEPKEAEPQKELLIPMAPDLPPTAQEPIKNLEIDQEQRQEPIRAHPRQESEQEDLGLGEEVGMEKREGNGSGKKGRKKGRGTGLSLPLTPTLTTAAFLLSLAVLAFHFLKGRRKMSIS